MTWTYSGDPSTSPRDEVRFLVGDTREEPHSLSDTEIAFLLRDGATTNKAAAEAADRMGNYFVKLSASTKKVGDLWVQSDKSSVANGYFALAQRLRGSAPERMGAFPFSDTTPKVFSVGMDGYNEDLT